MTTPSDTQTELQNQIDATMSKLGYERAVAVKDHRTVERYEYAGGNIQNVSKDLATLIHSYVTQARMDERTLLNVRMLEREVSDEEYPWTKVFDDRELELKKQLKDGDVPPAE